MHRLRTTELDRLLRCNAHHDRWQALIEASKARSGVGFLDHINDASVFSFRVVLKASFDRVERERKGASCDSSDGTSSELFSQSLSSTLLRLLMRMRSRLAMNEKRSKSVFQPR